MGPPERDKVVHSWAAIAPLDVGTTNESALGQAYQVESVGIQRILFHLAAHFFSLPVQAEGPGVFGAVPDLSAPTPPPGIERPSRLT